MRPSPSSLLGIPRASGRVNCSSGAAAAVLMGDSSPRHVVISRSRIPAVVPARRFYCFPGQRRNGSSSHSRPLRRHRGGCCCGCGGCCIRGSFPTFSTAMAMAMATTTTGEAAAPCSLFYNQLRRLSTPGGRDDGSGGGRLVGNRNDEVSGNEEGATKKKRGGRRGPLATLRVHGPDRMGIVASFSNLLYSRGCSIVDSASERSADTETGADLFFQRILFDYGADSCRGGIEDEIRGACREMGMHGDLDWDYGLDDDAASSSDDDDDENDEEGAVPTVVPSDGKRDRTTNVNGKRKKRVAVMVSRYDHCLWELLLRHRAGELPNCDVVAVLSNHPDLKHVADTFSVPYHVFPIAGSSPADKAEVERRELDLLMGPGGYGGVDVVVLARYMQVLSKDFCDMFPNRIINIHHSFLPAFRGGRPYHRAHERGVKLIGATAHYTTVDLDEGPIIEQDIARISHRDTVKDLIRKGRTLEKTVLVHALRAHLEDRIIVYKNRCIVFGE